MGTLLKKASYYYRAPLTQRDGVGRVPRCTRSEIHRTAVVALFEDGRTASDSRQRRHDAEQHEHTVRAPPTATSERRSHGQHAVATVHGIPTGRRTQGADKIRKIHSGRATEYESYASRRIHARKGPQATDDANTQLDGAGVRDRLMRFAGKAAAASGRRTNSGIRKVRRGRRKKGALA